MFHRPTLREVIVALKPLADIPRPYTDNEGDPLNGRSVLPYLSLDHANQVCRAVELASEYARTSDGNPDRRALRALTRHGFTATLNPDQYDQDNLVGDIVGDGWHIDISDVPSSSHDY